MHRWFEAGVFLALVALLIAIGYVSDPGLTGFAVDEPGAYVHPEVEAMLAQDGDARVIVEYRDRISARDVRSIAQRYRSGRFDRNAVDQLRRDRSIKALYPDVEVSTRLDESLTIIDAARAQASVSGGSGAVCVIDTGVDYTHPDLGGCSAVNGSCRVVGGYDFVNDDDDPMDDEGHGTHVAGIVSAVAPNASIVAIKSLNDEGSGWLSDVMEGVEWCRANADAYNISVISMSLGGPNIFSSACDSYNEPWTAVLESAIAEGLLVVSATGNTGSTLGVNFPACVSSMIRVGATHKVDSIASYTNRGPDFSDIVLAPGSMIEAAQLGGGSIVKSGTSMATPHVSGAFALMVSYADSQNETIDQATALAAVRGLSIEDNETNLSFVRIDALSSLATFDATKPTVTVSDGDELIFWNVSDDLELDTVNVTLYAPNATIIGSNASAQGNVSTSGFGTYRLEVYANDTAGNALEANVSIAILDVPNLLLRVNETSGNFSVVSTQNLTINATMLHGETFDLFVNGTLLVNGNASYVSSYRFEAPGTYTLSMVHNATDTFESANETVMLSVLDGSPIIVNATLGPIEFSETSEQLVWVNASDPLDAGLAYNWTADGDFAGNASNVTINGSIGLGNRTLAVNVSNIYGSVVREWNLTVTAVPPELNVTPASGVVELAPNTSRFFSVQASDPFGRTISYEWMLNGTVIGTGTNVTVLANETTNASNLSVVVSNGNASANGMWTLVMLPPLSFETVIDNATWREDQSGLSFDLSEHFAGVTDASFTLNATNFSMSVQGTNARFSRQGTGSEEVSIIAARNNETAASNAFTLTVTQKPVSSGSSGAGSGGSSGGGSSGGSFGSSISRTEPEPEPEPLVDRVVQQAPDAGVRVDVHLVRSSRNASVSVREASLPDTLPSLGRPVYKSLEATLEGAEAQNATFSFEVDPDWVVSNELTAQDVALYRYNGTWQELGTEFMGLQGSRYRYVSVTPGFSYFAIGARAEPEPIVVEIDMPSLVVEPDVEERSGDGLAVLILVLGLVALAVFSSRRTRVRS